MVVQRNRNTGRAEERARVARRRSGSNLDRMKASDRHRRRHHRRLERLGNARVVGERAKTIFF